MSVLTFRLKEEPDQRLDLSNLTPGRLAGLDRAAIGALQVGTTKVRLTVADVFDVAGDDPATIRFDGGSKRFDGIGEAMESGEIVVEGDAGWRVGRLMSGGVVTVTGSVEGLAGSGMAGGFLEINGDAGDLLGGPMAGEMAGMRGGAIRVGGNVGARCADRMRRGTIVVDGDAGENAASRMIAGTLVVGGTTRGTPGRLMKRGTLVLCGGVERLAPTFLDCGVHDLLILRLMVSEFARTRIGAVPFGDGPMRKIGGDTAVMGLGEIYLPLD